jgi:hypothetical protein
MGFCGTDRFSYDQNLPANHANSRESKRGTLSNAILISAVADHRSLGSILARIRVIRGLNVSVAAEPLWIIRGFTQIV